MNESSLNNSILTFCKNYSIHPDEIVSFVLLPRNAVKLEKLSLNLRNELNKFCRKDVEQQVNENPIMDLTLEQLAILENLSQRTINLCNDQGLKTLSKIYQYKIINNNFKKIRNCGTKSNEELTCLCANYTDYIINNLNTDIFSGIKELLKKEEIINEQTIIELTENVILETLRKIEDLSIRSYNACKQANLTTLQSIVEYSYNHSDGFLRIKNCGRTSNDELLKICSKYETKIKSIRKGFRVEPIVLSPVDSFLSSLKLDSSTYLKVREIIELRDRIPVFKILDFLINNEVIFGKEKFTQVFKRTFNCFLPIENCTLKEVGNQVNLTRERVRQIREEILEKFNYQFEFLSLESNTSIFHAYIEDLDKPVIYLSETEINKINTEEGTAFSSIFITYSLSVIYKKKFVLVNEVKPLLSNDFFKNDFTSKNLFLVNRVIASHFDFSTFLKWMKGIIPQKRDINQFFSFDEIILKFKTNDGLDVDALKQVLIVIINSSFQCTVQVNPDGLIFLQNSKRTLLSYIQEILQNSHKPLHFKEIHKFLLDIGLKVTSEESVHSLLIREREIFGLKGHGTFGLRSKGGLFGSIGDIAEHIIKERKSPVSMHELENIICEETVYARESINNILFNYYNEARFVKLSNGYVNLKELQANQEEAQLRLF